MATTTTEPLQQQLLATTSTPEEDHLRRNTDCVYFLASPLICKKGSECEFRHSEAARRNPTDCYYWLNGSCLMPKCTFRHPPLDGLAPPHAGNFAGAFPPALPSGAPFPLTPQNAGKQAVPCVFFQRGHCVKGGRCPFLHGPAPPTSIKGQQVSVPAAATGASALKKTFGGLEKCTKPKMVFQANTPITAEAPRLRPEVTNSAPKVQLARPSEGLASVNRVQQPGVVDEAFKHKERTLTPIDSGNLRGRTARPLHVSSVDDYNHQNGRDIDHSLRESSPGFDVLVDDEVREDEYYPTGDQYVRMRGQGTSLIDFDGGHLDDYNRVATVDTRSRRAVDPHGGYRDNYVREQRGPSSERPLGARAHYDRRGLYRSRSPDFTQNSDLRHRLIKQRNSNGLRSVVNGDITPDSRSEDQSYRSSRRDTSRSPVREYHTRRSPIREYPTRRSPIRENSIGCRLQGRIRLPGRSPASGSNMYSERDHERRTNRGRTSPGRPQAPAHQGRLRDRLSGRIQDESNEGRSFRGLTSKDSLQGNGVDFVGPKRLSELKGLCPSDTRQHQQLTHQQLVSGGKLRDTVLPSSLGTDSGLSFDAPKPLSEILKRKRDAGVKPDNNETTAHVENNVDPTAETSKQIALSSEPEQTQAAVDENTNFSKSEGDEEGEISNKKIKIIDEETSILNHEEQPEIEDGSPEGDGEEQEYEEEEEYDHGDGEYDYEHDGTEYNLNEDAADHEGDYMDEDDGDDFAKKLGVSF